MSVAHLASVGLGVPIDFAFARVSDPAELGRWALGSMNLQPVEGTGLYRGTSLFDGEQSLVEIRAYPELGLIDYHVGGMETRKPRVSIRLTPGADWGRDAATCLAAMSTWRASWMDDERWKRTCVTHETEVLLFRAQIEKAWADLSKT